MSLIIETLNKMETKGIKNQIPPFFQKDFKQKNKVSYKKIYVYVGIFISLSFPSMYISKIIADSNQNILNHKDYTVIKNTAPIVMDIPKIENEQFLNEDTETISLEKDLSQLENLNIASSVFLEIQNIVNHTIIPEIKRKTVLKKSQINLDFEFNSFVSIADSFYNQKDFENSIKWYEKALNIKKDEYVITQLLSLYIQKNNFKNVYALLPEIKNEQVAYSVLTELIENNQIQTAKDILDKKINLDKNGYLIYLKGLIAENEKDFAKAEELYKKAFEKNSLDPYLGYSYGRILEINKKYTEALSVYLKIQNLKKDIQLENTVSQRISILRRNIVF